MLWLLILLGWAATAWLDGLLRRAGLREEAWLVAGNLPAVVGTVTAATVGAVLASRRPAHPAVGNPLAVPALGALFVPCALVALVGLVVGAGSLLGRFRRARGTERLQLRWLALAAAVSAAALLLALATLALSGGDTTLFRAAFGVSVGVLPLATGAAILRYRLYDLDRIVSRTLAYGLLTVLLGGGYAAVVLGLGQRLGQDSSLVVAAVTLAVAAVFQPARRRVQAAVDRRFNRRRYDAATTIAAFSARLREEVDLATLTGELLAVVEQTMQPTQASLWLRPAAGRSAQQVGIDS